MIKVAFTLVGLIFMGSAVADNSIETAPRQATFADLQINEPGKDMDELVINSIYENDRRFSRVG